MKIKKILLSFGVLLLSCVVFAGCSGSNTSSKSSGKKENVDTAFISSLSSGLVEREKLADSQDKNNDSSKSSFLKDIQAELDSVSSYKNKKFKNGNLEKLADQYISILKDSKKEVQKNFDSVLNDTNEQWNKDYTARVNLLYIFYTKYNLNVSGKEKKDFDSLISDGKKAYEFNQMNKWDASTNTFISPFSNLKFTKAQLATGSDGDPDVTYPVVKVRFTVTNKTKTSQDVEELINTSASIQQEVSKGVSSDLDFASAVDSDSDPDNLQSTLEPGATVSGYFCYKLKNETSPIIIRLHTAEAIMTESDTDETLKTLTLQLTK